MAEQQRNDPSRTALGQVFAAVRQHSREHALRYGDWPTPVVLVGRDMWSQICREVREMTAQLVVSSRRLPEGVLLMAAPGGKEAEIFAVRHVGQREWRVLSGLGVAGELPAEG